MYSIDSFVTGKKGHGHYYYDDDDYYGGYHGHGDSYYGGYHRPAPYAHFTDDYGGYGPMPYGYSPKPYDDYYGMQDPMPYGYDPMPYGYYTMQNKKGMMWGMMMKKWTMWKPMHLRTDYYHHY